MKSRTLRWITPTILFAVLALPTRVSSQSDPANKPNHHHYKLIDLGTLGGPVSYFSEGGFGTRILNNSGTIAGYADIATPDPSAPCFNTDCFLSHTFRWEDGVLTDLGTTPGANTSAASGINELGWIVGVSSAIDRVTGVPHGHAALWKDNLAIDLGTLGGADSNAIEVNNHGQVVGFSTNSIPDPFDPFGLATQLRTFIWEKGVMKDLGSLGGPDAAPGGILNERGQVVGSSYINFVPNPASGVPTADPFLWEDGHMIDLGSFGGTSGYGLAVNNRGQVIGQSNLAGDVTAHAFLWEQGALQDLGALGGTFSIPHWLNDTGDIVGGATTTGDQLFHAFLWRNGVMQDLGTVGNDGCSEALAVNSEGQTVGQSFSCDFSTVRAFLWENGSMIDLNTLIPPNSSLQLVFAGNINDRGVIVGAGVPAGDPPNTDLFGRLFMLIPCNEDHPGVDGCDYSLVDETATATDSAKPATQTGNTAKSALPPDAIRQLIQAAGRRPNPWYRGRGARSPK